MMAGVAWLLCACHKGNDITPAEDHKGIPTPVGVAAGVPVSATIDGSGGMLTAPGGSLEVVFPPGALSVSTTVTIQPISNYCPNGMQAYRLLPEGIHFQKPVYLRFHYQEQGMNGIPELLGIAYQDEAGIWKRLRQFTLDTVHKTIMVETNHFSDWSLVEMIRIKPAGNSFTNTITVKPKEEIEMQVITVGDLLEEIPYVGIDDLVPLPLPDARVNVKWYVNAAYGVMPQ
ncbi:hypothetical protein [Paraflavitalea speifideaquila]|uniref:hypothetical protein n=1 Tax=Paraflavitalea speifideaquila TaxID=3076558 RepID=UPI0028EB3CFC|nr:hypothetical protein [Paraflavitalea speifideiaquila]